MRGAHRPRAAGPRFYRTRPVVFAIVAVVILSGGLGATAQLHLSMAGLGGLASTAVRELAAASASLAAGQGPAGGQALNCSMVLGEPRASCSSSSTVVNTTNKWESESSPEARAGAAMTYDGKDRYVLLFGGFNGSVYLNDTWEFTHGMWVQLAPTHSPSARANASMAYDARDGYVVLFGGSDGTRTLGDTWTFVGGQWSPLNPATSPPARKDATLTYDARDGYLVLFGGSSGSAPLGDTWTFLGGTWIPIAPSVSPSARWGSASTFDAADNYVLLFGGFDGTSLLGDSWEFASGQWTLLSPSSAPSPRYQAGLAYDANNSYVLLFGGASRSGSSWIADGDTWSFSAGTWTQRTVNASPSARQAASMTYSGVDNDVVVFGGISDGDPVAATDTWEYHTGSWLQIVSEPQVSWAQPAGRVGAGTAYDPRDNYVVAFGGSTAYGPNAETWTYLSLAPRSWVEIFPSVSPSPRAFVAMAYDATDGYVVLFGGMSGTGAALGDTWTFTGGIWTQIHPAVSPAARYGAMMTYDVADGYILLFGGTNGASYFSDTWTFHGGTWSKLSIANHPSPRAFGGLAWDNKTAYTALFGGTAGGMALGDTWKFLGGAWTALKPTGTPPNEWGMTFVADLKDNYVFMFGGCTSSGVDPQSPSCPASDLLGSVWAYRAGSWNIVVTGSVVTARPAQPSARFFASGAFDGNPEQANILFFGGIGASGTYITDRWVYQAALWNNWFPAITPSARYGPAFTYDDKDQKALLFGGIGPVSGGGTGFLADTWEWDTGIWGQALPNTAPSARAFASLTYDGTLVGSVKADNYTLLFGGVGPTGYLADTWSWSGSPSLAFGGGWTHIAAATSPSARSNASMTYDAADHYVLLFGGQNSGGYLGDTWAYSAGVWRQLSTVSAPSPRAGAAMVYDSEDHYVVLFGGFNGATALGDTWTFVGGVWTQLSPSISPSARFGASIVDSPQALVKMGGQLLFVLLVGGTTGSTFLGDTWGFLGGQWTLLPASVPNPVPFAFGGITDDIVDGHPAIFGGLTAGGPLGDFWEFKLGP